MKGAGPAGTRRLRASARANPHEPWHPSRSGLVAVLAATYVLGRLAVEFGINGRWAPAAESIAHIVLVPLVQSVVVWWLVVRRPSSAP